MNVTVFELRSANRDLVEEAAHEKAKCQFLGNELEIEAMKKKIKNENDKFEFNLVKLNLLTIIDKLKLRVDHEKIKYQQLRNRVIPTGTTS